MVTFRKLLTYQSNYPNDVGCVSVCVYTIYIDIHIHIYIYIYVCVSTNNPQDGWLKIHFQSSQSNRKMG